MTMTNILPKKFFLAIFFLISSFFLFVFPSFAQEYKPDEVVVKMRPSNSLEERLKFHHEIGAQQTFQIENLGVDILHFEGIPIERILERLKSDPRILYAEPNYKATAFDMTNDPALLQNLQWGLLKVQAAANTDSAWTISRGRSSIQVAVLDTGIDSNHQDLQGKVSASKNCTDSNTVDDRYGHGTHVSGIISADTNNGIGVAGVGYNISLINAKGLGDDGSGYYSWLADCLVWATDNGAKVINMSLGGSSDSQLLSDAINYAWNKGVVLVAAAGNSGSNSPSYPGYYSNVISVAATDQNDAKASFSNYGNWVKVAAPGVGIYSTLPDTPNAFKQTTYGYGSGTSMATPFVSGLAGLIFSLGNFDNTTVVNYIQNNADKIPGTGSNWVYGRINAYQSLLAARGTGNVRPSISPTPTNTPTPIPTSTPTPKPTSTPTPTPTPTTASIPVSPKAPTPPPVPPWLARLCSRLPILCH
ncbi:peptidase S8 [Candidatus Gottesmanbacteria bacterium]|nr:peptidase S8 [Candidatus Gottesmanbacteria bacterium]